MSDEESKCCTDTPPCRKKRKVMQRYKAEYAEKYPVIRKSSVGDNHAFCILCGTDFSVAHGGMLDVKKHIETAKHKSKEHARASARKVTDMFPTDKNVSVIRAETFFTDFIIEHNLPLACADHAGALFRNMFPDSAIAAKYSCARTKTGHIADTLAESDSQRVASMMQKQPFSIGTDGSNDIGSVKLYPVCVRYFDPDFGKVFCVMLSLKECAVASTGQNIFNLMNDELSRYKIPWENCLSFAADNASVMQGCRSGVASYVLKAAPAVYMVGCPCHLLHLTAGKAAGKLSVKVDELLIDIYYYMDKSSKRLQEFQSFQAMRECETHKILKHVSVRWLSLGVCLSRLLEQWPALEAFFNSELAKSSSGHTAELVKSSSHTKPPSLSHSAETTKSSTQPKTSTHSAETVKLSSHIKPSGHSAETVKSSSHIKPSSHTAELVKSSSHTKPSSLSHSAETTKTSSQVKPSGHRSSGTSKHSTVCDVSRSGGMQDFNLSSYLFREGQVAAAAIEHKKQQKAKQEATKATIPKSDTRVSRVCRMLSDPYTKLICLFLQYTIPLFDHVNIVLQRDEPCVHILHGLLEDQLRNIMVRFVKPAVVSSCPNLTAVKYNDECNHKDNNDIAVGTDVRNLLASDCYNLSTERVSQFYQEVKLYYITACDYMLKKFPYNDPVLVHAQVVDISNRTNQSFADLQYFINRFPCLAQQDCTVSLDTIEQEFLMYQVVPLPTAVTSAERIDMAWHLIGQMRDAATGNAKFRNLSSVMKGILTIFHSNADCERIFSLVQKNKTDYRPNMSTRTLGSLLTRKMMQSAQANVCHSMQYSTSLLHRAKSATYTHHQLAQSASASVQHD